MLPDALKETSAAVIGASFPELVVSGQFDRGEIALEIVPDGIVPVCRFLKEEQQFVRLSDVTAVDWHPADPRFEVVYHLHSIARNERLRLKCRVSGDEPSIDSVICVWRSADWYEREIFDLFGIEFRNHPDLRRILMPENWEGHPLRKDYPVHGYNYGYKDESGTQ